MSDRSEVVNEDRMELPPAFAKFVEQLKTDRKMLMREKAYEKPEQIRAFLGQYLFARLTQMIELMGFAIYDVYGLAVSNANQQQRMRAYLNKQLRKLGASVSDDEDEELPGVGPEILDDLQQAFYGLGTLLEKKLPDDKEVQEAYNRCAAVMSQIVAELIGQGDDPDEDEDEESEEEKKPDDTEGAEEAGDEKPVKPEKPADE